MTKQKNASTTTSPMAGLAVEVSARIAGQHRQLSEATLCLLDACPAYQRDQLSELLIDVLARRLNAKDRRAIAARLATIKRQQSFI